MPHRRKLQGLPRFGPAETTAPALGQDERVRISGAIRRAGRLVFHADGPETPPGIYEESPGVDAGHTLLVADTSDQLNLKPVDAGPLLALHRGSIGRVPSHTEAVVLRDSYGVETVVQGQAFGVSGDGQLGAVLDLAQKQLKKIDLATRGVQVIGELMGAIDPQLVPAASLSHDGSAVVYLDAAEERSGACLEYRRLDGSRAERLLGPLPDNAWAVGAVAPGGDQVVALEVRPGDAPLSRLLQIGLGGEVNELLRLEVAQPASLPAFITPDLVVLPLTLKPYPLATYGPVDLVAVPLAGGAMFPLTQSGDIHGQARLLEEAIWVEGGATLVRIPLL